MLAPRRSRLCALYCAMLAWVTVNLVCGTTVRSLAFDACAAPARSCCEHDGSKQACPVSACSLTCAVLLTAQVSDTAIEISPVVTVARLEQTAQHANARRAPPLLTPPRLSV